MFYPKDYKQAAGELRIQDDRLSARNQAIRASLPGVSSTPVVEFYDDCLVFQDVGSGFYMKISYEYYYALIGETSE
jgi:hypothetical protein